MTGLWVQVPICGKNLLGDPFALIEGMTIAGVSVDRRKRDYFRNRRVHGPGANRIQFHPHTLS
jgi:hypothetical protein